MAKRNQEADILRALQPGLTPKERKLAKFISSQGNLQKIADELGVSHKDLRKLVRQNKKEQSKQEDIYTRKIRRSSYTLNQGRKRNRKLKPEPQIRKELKETITKWLQYCKRRLSESTTELYGRRIKEFGGFLTKANLEITPDTINSYVDTILDRCKKRTANNMLIVIKSFCHWYFGSDNPASSIKVLKEDPPKQRCLRPEEYKAVLAAITNPIDRAVIQFLGNTGLRRGEFCTLKTHNIDSKKKYITIIGKGNKRRTIPTNKIIRDILQRYNRLQFIEPYRITLRLNKLCWRLSEKANIDRFSPHALRHFFATRLVNKGVSIVKVSRMLGHSSVRTTELIYCHLMPMDFDGETECLTF